MSPIGSDAPTPSVRRDVDLEVPPEEAWELVVDDDERAGWFGGETTLDPEPGGGGTFTDPDGTRRDATIDVVEPSRRISWTWWPADDREQLSRVEVELVPLPDGTRVSVTETPLAPVGRQPAGRAFALAA